MEQLTSYRCVASSVEGFVQQLAVSYLRNGYFFYVTGHVREGKDARAVDRKVVERYGIAVSKFTRARKKKSGTASLQYLRHGQFFVLLATEGKHRFFAEERAAIRDARRVPIRFAGYSLSYRSGRVSVRIDRGTYLNLKAYFENIATKASPESLARQLWALPFEPYAPVRVQLLSLLRSVNRCRQVAGLPPVPVTAVRMKRRIVRPFAEAGQEPPPFLPADS